MEGALSGLVEYDGGPAHLAVLLAAPDHGAVMIQEFNDPIRKVDTAPLGCRPEVPAHKAVHITSLGVHGASGGPACNTMARANLFKSFSHCQA